MPDPRFHSKPNFQVRCDSSGDTFWVSRSVAVVPVPFFCVQGKGGQVFLPLGKRSPESLLEAGFWSLASGFVEWNESLKGAVLREMWEEMGLNIKPEDLIAGSLGQPFSVYSKPNKSENETIAMRMAFAVECDRLPELRAVDQEMSELQWINYSEVSAGRHAMPYLAFQQNAVVAQAWTHLQEQIGNAMTDTSPNPSAQTHAEVSDS